MPRKTVAISDNLKIADFLLMVVFEKMKKLQNLFHVKEQGISCTEILVVSISIRLQNAAKQWEILGHWQSNLWTVELYICYSNVHGKISFAPLNILSSECKSVLCNLVTR